MTSIKPYEIKSFDLLKIYAKHFGYNLTRGGHLRQNHWNGVSFAPNGEIRYMKNGTVICEKASFEAMAILMQLLPSAKDLECKEKCAFYKNALQQIKDNDQCVCSLDDTCQPQRIEAAALRGKEYGL